ncbi:MAG: DUF6475 domain-containing protein [Acidiferrobacter sp.]
MDDREIAEFAVVVADVYELYGRECPDGIRGLWWEALKNYSIVEVRQAFSAHVRNPDGGQFLPKPADVRKNLEGGGESRALRAWTKVDQAVRRVGPWESVVCDDPLIHAVIADMGGWAGFGQVTDDEWPFKRNEFVKRYQGYVLRPPQTFSRALSGHAAQQNARVGGDAPLPRLIGDPNQATQTYLAGQEVMHRYPHLAANFVKDITARLSVPTGLDGRASEDPDA